MIFETTEMNTSNLEMRRRILDVCNYVDENLMFETTEMNTSLSELRRLIPAVLNYEDKKKDV